MKNIGKLVIISILCVSLFTPQGYTSSFGKVNVLSLDKNGNLRVVSVTPNKLTWETNADFDTGTHANTEARTASNVDLLQPASQGGDISYTTEANYTLSDGTKLEVIGGLAKLKGNPSDRHGQWHLNESTGTTVADSSGNGRDGTATNMENADWVSAHLNNGLIFDGVDEFVNLGNIADFERTDSFSFEFWFKTATSGVEMILSKQLNSGTFRGWNVFIESGMITTALVSDNGASNRLQKKTDSPFNDGSFHHVVVTYDGSSTLAGLLIYMDGSLAATTNITDNLSATISHAGDTQMSGRGGANVVFTGTLDEVVIYNEEVSAVNVALRYNSGVGTEEAGSAFPLDDNLYIDTKDASQINVTGISVWDTLTAISTLPASTDIRVLLSNDGRSTWLTWNGSAWVTEASPTLRANAIVLATAITNFASLPLGDLTLDVRLFLFSSNNTVTPSVDNLNVFGVDGYPTSSSWESAVFNSTFDDLDWGKVVFVTNIPSGTTVVITARTGNDADLSTISYSSSLPSGNELTTDGQYLQFKVEFTGTASIRSSVEEIDIFFEDIGLVEQSP